MGDPGADDLRARHVTARRRRDADEVLWREELPAGRHKHRRSHYDGAGHTRGGVRDLGIQVR